MKYQTLENIKNEFKKTITPQLVLDFLANYFNELYPVKFCDAFSCDNKFDKNDGITVKMVLHSDYFEESVTVYPFDIKTSITNSQNLVIAWRKYMNSLFPNYKQAYKEFFLKKEEEKIEKALLEF